MNRAERLQALDEYQYPFTQCSSCGADLTGDSNVDLTLSIGGNVTTVKTCLDEEGRLQDADGAIANGYHSRAECASCGEDLEDLQSDWIDGEDGDA